MSQPSEPAFLNFTVDTCASILLVKVVVGNFVGPEDVGDLSQTAVVKGIDFSNTDLTLLLYWDAHFSQGYPVETSRCFRVY